MSQGLWILVAALLLACAFGLLRAARDGRFRGTHAVRSAAEAPSPGPAAGLGGVTGVAGKDLPLHGLPHQPGERATLLQFSSAFCAPCRTTRRVLSEVSDLVPGVAHVEVDAEQHLDVVRRLGIVRTPTTLVLDAHGREVSRASGAPTKALVLATLNEVVS